MKSKDPYQEAQKRVKKKKNFYQHLATYAVFCVFFFIVNMLTSPSYPWFIWPILGWGVGVAANYFDVFGWPGSGVGSNEWEDRELAKEIEKIEARSDQPIDMDAHLELRQIDPKKEKEKAKNYQDRDFV